MTYHPDGWVLCKINTKTPHYKVFATWRGGYVSGDSWRMNSGITKCYEDGDEYVFEGHSGSKYVCHKDLYNHLGMYGSGVLNEYVDKSKGKIEVFDEIPLGILEMDWLL